MGKRAILDYWFNMYKIQKQQVIKYRQHDTLKCALYVWGPEKAGYYDKQGF